jgi:3D (Asp-Asp-Asp) domain-containing protein
MRYLRHLLALAAIIGCVSCASSSTSGISHGRTASLNRSKSGGNIAGATSAVATNRIGHVKTTAYTHSESDHKVYGATTAIGTTLKYGNVRSAATDWSVYPVGTVFQIEGESPTYEVDDYGSALVGTNTIDLYKPDKGAMRNWGVRNVNICVLKWGSFARSLSIMRPRTGFNHVNKMVKRIEKS